MKKRPGIQIGVQSLPTHFLDTFRKREREKKLADLVSSFLFFEPYLEGKKRSRRRRLPGTAEADIRVYGPEKKCRKEWTGVVLRCSVGYLATFWPDLRQSKVKFYGEHCQGTALGCLQEIFFCQYTL